jgi:OOP family OmpA-OmpF porin
MKRIFVGALVITMLMAISLGAVEWNGRLGFGLRGPLVAPMIKGSDYKIAGRTTYEPFMMGLGGGVEIKYGLTKSLVVGLSGGYWFTYDDSSAAEDQSFKLNKKTNASAKIKVIPIGLTGQYYFIPESNVQPYLLAGVGVDIASVENVNSGDSYAVKDFTGKAGAGFNFWIGEKLTFDLGFRFSYLLANLSSDVPNDWYGIPDYTKTKSRPYMATLEPGIGITYFFGGPKDTDKDGIKDKFDQCPNTPIGAIVDQYGCPIDSDGDGVYDGLDRCPDTPKGAVVDINGCPIDSDGDGVFDGLDKCPDTPAGVTVDANGCPLDSDGDGVPDYKDKQPDTPKGAIVDINGVAIDSDRDGVPDGLDKCPDTPAGTKVDTFGCPIAKPISDKITLNINYQPNSTEADSAAKVALDDIAVSLKAYPDIKISINGFTDALGSARTNLKISQERADAIMKYFMDKGIASERMTAKGYGEDKNYFVAENDTPEGRAKNRRIEIAPLR